jgi:sugar/nucleoside kinase (ribokinase family)
MSRARIDVVHVGAACRDVAPDDPRGWRLGGGVTYAALTTARLGLTTAAVIGVDATTADSPELGILRSAGVDLLAVPLSEGPVFHNVETPGGRQQTAVEVGVPVPLTPVPDSWREASAWSFTPVAGELDDAWLDPVGPSALVSVAWQGMLRRLSAGQRVERRAPEARGLLRRADLVGVSQDDVDGSTTIESLAGYLHTGARLLVTQGPRGGLLVAVGSDGPTAALRYLPTEADHEVDPTGAGDTFLAALLVATIRPSSIGVLRRRVGADLRFAAAAGSLAVEDIGLAGVPALPAVRARSTREQVRRLVARDFRGQVSVVPVAD